MGTRAGKSFNFWVTDPATIRESEALFEHLSRDGSDSRLVEGKTHFFRQLLAREIELFRHAPYRAEPSLFFVLVQGNGDILNLYRQQLHFNTGVPRLPLSLAFSEKKRYALAAQLEEPFGEEFKNHWLVNAFSTWYRFRNGNGHLDDIDLKSLTDPDQTLGDPEGVSKKFVRLPLEETSGNAYVAERIKLIKNHILRLGLRDSERTSASGSTTDHADFDLVVPSLDTTFLIAVDLDIFKNGALRQRAKVSFKLRLIGGPTWETSLPSEIRPNWMAGRRVNGIVTCDTDAESIIPKLESLCKNIQERISPLVEEPRLRKLTTSPWMSMDKIEQLSLPGDIIFGKLEWPFPPFGSQVSFGWDISDDVE